MQTRSIFLALKDCNISFLLIPLNPFYNNYLYLFITDEPPMDKVAVLILTNYVFKMDHSPTVHEFFYFKINL